MIFVLDNYDSFTFNLVQYLGELGADPVVARNDQISVRQVLEMGPSHIVLSPGPCTPREAGVSVDVIKEFAGRTPILGVCLGHQSMAYAYGDMATNLLDADSRIRDTDYAYETMKFTRDQIVIKSGESMLSQSNQMPSAVLRLMGG